MNSLKIHVIMSYYTGYGSQIANMLEKIVRYFEYSLAGSFLSENSDQGSDIPHGPV